LADHEPLRLAVDVGGLSDADLGTLDALAHATLACRRLGTEIVLVQASQDLRNLIALAGLARVVRCVPASVVESRGEAEEREEAGGIQEEGDAADAIGGGFENL
jgi:anti-anti-sigma regulatory factor